MRRAVILATLTLLLLTLAGITVAQESDISTEESYQTEPTTQGATTPEATEFSTTPAPARSFSPAGSSSANSVEPEAESSEAVEDRAARGQSKRAKRGGPKDVGKPEHARGAPEVAREAAGKGRPEVVGKRERAGKPPHGSEARGEEATHGGGQRKVTLCHKGKVSITVAAPAEAAHLRHGDSPGACGP